MTRLATTSNAFREALNPPIIDRWEARMSETAEVGMVERMARAMCNELGVNPDDWHEEGGARTYAWQKEAGTARAALEAMREPTQAMLDATGELGVPDRHYRDLFTAMIDAALQETDR